MSTLWQALAEMGALSAGACAQSQLQRTQQAVLQRHHAQLAEDIRIAKLMYPNMVKPRTTRKCDYCGRPRGSSTRDQCEGCGAWREELR